MAVVMRVTCFEVFLVNLDPTVGAEIKKTRPCLIISPDEMNLNIATVIIAPMTTVIRGNYPTRIACVFEGKTAQIVLDQLRTVDKCHLIKSLGYITDQEQQAVINVLQEMFAA